MKRSCLLLSVLLLGGCLTPTSKYQAQLSESALLEVRAQDAENNASSLRKDFDAFKTEAASATAAYQKVELDLTGQIKAASDQVATLQQSNKDLQQALAGKPGAASKQFVEPKTDDQKTFYALGVWLSQRATSFDLSPSELKYVETGLNDAALGRTLKADVQTFGPKLQELAQKRGAAAQAKEQAKAMKEAGPQKEKGKIYAAAAAKEKDAYKSASGMVFIPIKEGTGASPKASDTVKVHYVGTLIDGTEFDSSVKRGQPAEFPLGGVIPCWTEGVQRLKVGGKAKLVCPSDIAYGDQGRPPTIPGGATLVFQVELLDITTKPAAEMPVGTKTISVKPSH